jgi:hypothetical protein
VHWDPAHTCNSISLTQKLLAVSVLSPVCPRACFHMFLFNNYPPLTGWLRSVLWRTSFSNSLQQEVGWERGWQRGKREEKENTEKNRSYDYILQIRRMNYEDNFKSKDHHNSQPFNFCTFFLRQNRSEVWILTTCMSMVAIQRL